MQVKIEKRVYPDYEEYALIELGEHGEVLRVETFLTWWGVRTAKARWLKNELTNNIKMEKR